MIRNVNEAQKALPVKTELTEPVRLLVQLGTALPSGIMVQAAVSHWNKFLMWYTEVEYEFNLI